MRGRVDTGADAGATDGGGDNDSRAGAASFDEHAATPRAAQTTKTFSGWNILRVL